MKYKINAIAETEQYRHKDSISVAEDITFILSQYGIKAIVIEVEKIDIIRKEKENG